MVFEKSALWKPLLKSERIFVWALEWSQHANSYADSLFYDSAGQLFQQYRPNLMQV